MYPQGPQPGVHPQQPPMAHVPMMFAHHPYYQQPTLNQARMSTPNQAAASASQTQSQANSVRNSPMASSQTLSSRSPMPQNSQQAALAAHPPQQSYNYAAMQYGAQMRPMAHPQLMQHHMAAQQGNAAAGQQVQVGQPSQEQQPIAPVMQYPHMFPVNYQMAVQQGRIPQHLWQLGRMTVANGQHPMTGMPGHPQQMALGAGKVPGGMQGS